MTSIVDTLKSLLFSARGVNAFAVLDGASVPGLLDKLYGAPRPEFVCLYRGEIAPDLAQVAPYLVQLAPQTDFTDWVLGQGWGKHWGVFATTAADLAAMRGHLRRFLMVYDPKGKPVYFRFYDPRVLRVFLPTCNTGELGEFFGPVASFVLEGEEPETILTFAMVGGALAKHEERLALASKGG